MVAQQNDPEDSEDEENTSSFFDEQVLNRVRSIKNSNRETIDGMDTSIAGIQSELESIKSSLKSLPKEERRLMTVLVARSIRRSLREILLEQVDTSD